MSYFEDRLDGLLTSAHFHCSFLAFVYVSPRVESTPGLCLFPNFSPFSQVSNRHLALVRSQNKRSNIYSDAGSEYLSKVIVNLIGIFYLLLTYLLYKWS